MQRRHALARLSQLSLLGSGLLSLADAAQAQAGGSALRLVVPYPPGGPLDSISRALANQARETLGPIVVDNKPGAGGNIGADLVAKAAPDGRTIVLGAVATHAINPWLYSKIPYDPVKDFAPITLIARVPNVLVLTPETSERLGIRTVAELINHAKRNPGELNYGSGGNGSAGHLAGKLLETMAGIKLNHIPYGGAAAAQIALLAGQVAFNFDNLAAAAANIRASKLMALAVTSAKRSYAMAELPTMAETGLKGFAIDTWFGLFAPAKTPADVIERLNGSFRKALETTELRVTLNNLMAEPSGGTPAQLGELVSSELAKYKTLVAATGAKAD
jgi:tripartite-type tricarboxylate transporter receptor subunit TctC